MQPNDQSNIKSHCNPLIAMILIQFSSLGVNKKICLENSLYVLNDWIGSTQYVYHSREANTVNPILLLIKQIQSGEQSLVSHNIPL